jgi:hypothetical protein
MSDTKTQRFIVSALQLAAEAWDQLAREAGMPEFEEQARQARGLASTLQGELDREVSTNE